MTTKMIEKMLEKALNDGIVKCPKCKNHLEPDYDVCCGKRNPLKEYGLI